MKIKNKFKDGDIIVWEDQFYVCKIAGKEESVFIKAEIHTGGWCSTQTECGITLPSDLSLYRINMRNDRFKYFKGQTRYNLPIRNPIVGFMRGMHTPFINFSALRENSISLYINFVSSLYRNCIKDVATT